MKKFALLFCIAILALGVNAYGLEFGEDITIFDENIDGYWHGANEDQEVEPGMEHGQKWDLEGFFINGTQLSMIGGYDFINGEWGAGQNFASGDLFIDVDGDARYGDIYEGSRDGNHTVSNTYGYDFVLDFDFVSMTYDVVEITADSLVTTAWYRQNQGSSPWTYVSGGDTIGSGSIEYFETTGQFNTFGDETTEFIGDWRNAVMVDVSFLSDIVPEGQEVITHFTMGCGNDNLMGAFDPISAVPEPSTLLLLGAGLLGLVGYGKRRNK